MKTFVINVSSNEWRRNHMISMLSGHACLMDYSFMHKGDLKDMDENVMMKYFGTEFKTAQPAQSCAYKHILVYLELSVDDKDDIYLILEDDIYLNKDFCMRINVLLEEIKARNLNNYIISLEDSNLKYVRKSVRKRGIHLYKESTGRMAGAYLIDKNAANSIIAEINSNKCNQPIDWFHNHCAKKGLINIYWAYPTMATQGSLNGKIKSTLDKKEYGFIKYFTFNINRLYKKLLYQLR